MKAWRSKAGATSEELRAAHRNIEEALGLLDDSSEDSTLEERLQEAFDDIEAGRVTEPTNNVDAFLESLRRDSATLRS